MEETEKPTIAPRAAAYANVWHAAALHIVLLMALLAAGMIFAVNDWATVKAVVAGLSLAIWGVAALILIPVGLVWLLEWMRPSPSEEPLHDAWLDE
jgi:hypothetical protein